MSKLERLLNLTAALLETGRPLTSEELQERVPGYPDSHQSFHRAFERDKDDLREMGVPIRLVPVPGTDPPVDGYRIPKDEYYLRAPGLEPDELAALHLAAGAIRMEGVRGVEALWKLGGAGDEPNADAVGGEELLRLPTDLRLVPLFTAASQQRVASFAYGGADRSLEVHRLGFRRGHWYVTGHDRSRDASRSFRVDRIDGEVSIGDAGAFERPPAPPGVADRQPWEMGEEDPVTARFLVDADQALSAMQHLGQQAVVEERPDGGLVFEVLVSNRQAFRSFVISFLEHGEVLSPPDLRADLIEWLEAIG